MPKKDLIRKIKDVDGLICFPYDSISSEVINNAKKLKVISTYSVGYDHIDLVAARKRKIKVGYTPDILTDATADLTIALILDLLRKVTHGDRLIRANKWKVIFGPYDYVGTDLKGKTLGIFGIGRIGHAVVKRAHVFGFNIIYHNRTRLSHSEEKKFGISFVEFDDLIRKSDVLSIHVPYTKETHHKINFKVLKVMKKTAFLVNTARGKIINQHDLIKALKSNIIAGAALDVFESEPIRKDNELTKIENVLLTPHIGSSSAETRKKMAQITVQNMVSGLNGTKMKYSVQ